MNISKLDQKLKHLPIVGVSLPVAQKEIPNATWHTTLGGTVVRIDWGSEPTPADIAAATLHVTDENLADEPPREQSKKRAKKIVEAPDERDDELGVAMMALIEVLSKTPRVPPNKFKEEFLKVIDELEDGDIVVNPGGGGV